MKTPETIARNPFPPDYKPLQPGAGYAFSDVGREWVEAHAPETFKLTWKALVYGQGKYALILGAGSGKREVGLGLESVSREELRRLHKAGRLPVIHFYDKAPTIPPYYYEMKRTYGQLIEMGYFPGVDLIGFNPPPEYSYNEENPESTGTRLVTLHGVVDHLRLSGINHTQTMVLEVVRPHTYSVRMVLPTGHFGRNFATEQQILCTRDSLRQLERLVALKHEDIIHLDIPVEAKLGQNLTVDYPASHPLPDRFAQEVISKGYRLLAFEHYALRTPPYRPFTVRSLEDKEWPASVMLVFERIK